MPTSRPSETLTIPEALSRAHAHWEAGQAAQAETLCRRVLAAVPDQPDALHLLGLMAHAYGHLDAAIAHLGTACRAPSVPASYAANLAEMCRQKGLLAQAEAAARQAVALDPALVAGWNNLGIVLQEAGHYDESHACLERVVALRPHWADAYNNLGNTCRRQQRFDLAETHYRRALALDPDSALAHSNLAFLLSTQGRLDEAAVEARTAIDLDPRMIDAYLNLADVEASRHRYDAVWQALDMLRAFAPHHPAERVARAKALRQREQLDAALTCAREALALAPHNAEAHHVLAQILQTLGRTDDALDAFAQAARLPGTLRESALLGRAALLTEAGSRDAALNAWQDVLTAFPGSARAIVGRADTRTFTDADDSDIAALEDYVAAGERHPLDVRVAARFALGKAYLDLGDGARAFAHLDEGNRLKRASFVYDSAAAGAWMGRIAQAFDAVRMAGSRDDAASSLPVFVIGMPHSGTTLIEQILASHPQVKGAGELPALRLAVDARGLPVEALAALPDDALAALGRDYLGRVEPLADGAARVVDKMPANFLYAGLIARCLPNARIIHARRDPVDTCLSCYSKLFVGEQRFTYDQTELGEFYHYYEQLLAHWRKVLPADRFIEVDYEALVDDVKHESRRMVAFLGLPWDDACLAFHENPRVVRSASVSQVRQPIYATSRGRWRRYAAHLQPLLAALGHPDAHGADAAAPPVALSTFGAPPAPATPDTPRAPGVTATPRASDAGKEPRR
ncbi:tetratricopeptide repeat-containing sulfotransferase family protein [Paraburkholderia heleia]|uniref:tetratricopeptide repeat-containing sulfotransferase family protein n=1 Tax=Paraburkholderia heleia TaxID=634127 RepID=UPI002AB6E03A|nr:sulfotransferase [Paraburkholderia heleia]